MGGPFLGAGNKLFPWLNKVGKAIRRHLWIIGGPVVFGLLLGGMEWLISASLYNALGIGAAAYVLAQLGFAEWERRLTQRLKEERNSLLKSLVEVQPGGASVERIPTDEENKRLKAKIDALEKELEEARSADKMGTPTVEREDSLEVIKRVTAERDALREEKRQDLQNQRRKRIEEWQSFIGNFDFVNGKFASTRTYAQMRPHLRPEVIEMFETPRGLYVGNEARGDTAYRYTLLDQVARIEKEWGLI